MPIKKPLGHDAVKEAEGNVTFNLIFWKTMQWSWTNKKKGGHIQWGERQLMFGLDGFKSLKLSLFVYKKMP